MVKPVISIASLYKSISSNGQSGDEREAIEITGLTIGLGKRNIIVLIVNSI